MLSGLKNQVLWLALLFILQTPFCFAQVSENLNLKFDGTQSGVGRRVPVPKNGEFKLSLGSQMIDPALPLMEMESLKLPGLNFATNFPGLEPEKIFNNPNIADNLKFKSSLNKKQKHFLTTITLNNSYTEPTGNFNTAETDGLAISSESGRLKVYGSFDKRVVPQVYAMEAPNQDQAAGARNIRGSIIESPGENPEPTDKNAAMSSRYYLEAVYNFKPTLKGKVSFKRSMIDTFESEEALQLEGIVEANRNVLIKAGYNNEVRPEASEPRSTTDTKVWTEFILKF